MQRALESVWARLYADVGGARFERRGDLFLALYPPFPVPQCNGPWVAEDTEAAADALAAAVAEVEAAGAHPWVQTRTGQERAQQAAAELGLTHRELLPGMVVRPGELAAPAGDGLVISPIDSREIDVATQILATSFGIPREVLDAISAVFAGLADASWFVGRVDDEIVATALGVTIDDVTGVFNVATLPEYRGRGYGAALTAHVVRDGFDGGATLAYLQSSEMGHSVYRRLGFRDVEEYVLLTRPLS